MKCARYEQEAEALVKELHRRENVVRASLSDRAVVDVCLFMSYVNFFCINIFFLFNILFYVICAIDICFCMIFFGIFCSVEESLLTQMRAVIMTRMTTMVLIQISCLIGHSPLLLKLPKTILSTKVS